MAFDCYLFWRCKTVYELTHLDSTFRTQHFLHGLRQSRSFRTQQALLFDDHVKYVVAMQDVLWSLAWKLNSRRRSIASRDRATLGDARRSLIMVALAIATPTSSSPVSPSRLSNWGTADKLVAVAATKPMATRAMTETSSTRPEAYWLEPVVPRGAFLGG
ncbi:hypothetical protein NL676_039528 [Syzygium grande]|nr:hypothetical protein NL676_039528 [Syzygium grande]